MTPIPADVAAAIVAAGHSLSATATAPPGTSRATWLWCRDGSVELPAWIVCVSGACGRELTARDALLDALRRIAVEADSREATARAEWKRLRNSHGKERALHDAFAAAKRAADARALAAAVVALWPEVTP